MILNDYKEPFENPPTIDKKVKEIQQPDRDTFMQKIQNISEEGDPFEISTDLDTMANMINETPVLADELANMDFQAFFGCLMEKEIDRFALNLCHFLSELISNYSGNIYDIITDPVLFFLNTEIKNADTMYALQYNFYAITKLLEKCPSFKLYFFENGGFDAAIELFSIDSKKSQLTENYGYIIDLLTLFFICDKDNLQDENGYSIDQQIKIFQSIFTILQKTNIPLDVLRSSIVCLDTIVVWTLYLFDFYKENPADHFALYQEEALLHEVMNHALSSLKYNDIGLIECSLNILDNSILFGLNPELIESRLMDIQKQLFEVVEANKTNKIVGRVYKYMIHLIEKVNPDITLQIEPVFIQQAIELCDDDAPFEIKMQATRFLAVCIQMRPSSTVFEFMENYPKILPSLCSLINSKDSITSWIFSALSTIVDSLPNISIDDQYIQYIFDTIEISELKETLDELENQIDSAKPQNVFPIISALRHLIEVYENIIPNLPETDTFE